MDFYGFYTGKIFDAYEFLGAHPDKDGTTFRTFAPAASRITVIGEFNDWQEWELNKTYDGNFWECYAKGAKPGMMYKYRIYRLRRTLRSLRLRHGTPSELRVYHPRPVPLQIQRQQMDAEAFSMQGQTPQYLRTAFRLI